MKVRIEQFGMTYKVTVNGKRRYLDELAKTCNIGMKRLRAILYTEDRVKIIREFLLKSNAGIGPKCITHYHNHTPMWNKYVMRKAGVTQRTASLRIKQWLIDGDIKRLMYQSRYYDTKTKVVTVGKRGRPCKMKPQIEPKTPKKRGRPRKMVQIEPTVRPLPPTNPLVTDDNEFSDLSGLSDAKRDRNISRITVGSYELL